MNKIPGITIPDQDIDKSPNISLSTLNNEDALKQFREALDWFVQEVKATQLLSVQSRIKRTATADSSLPRGRAQYTAKLFFGHEFYRVGRVLEPGR